MNECPESDSLLAFLAGTADATSEEVEVHLQRCQDCQARMSRLGGLFQVAGALEVFQQGNEKELDEQFADRTYAKSSKLYAEYSAADVVPEMRTMAVMFTDMADSTKYAESHGSRAAYEKRQTHNKLLFPIIDAHQGTLVEVVGDALLVVFDETSDAARCAIAMQRKLEEFNSSENFDVESLEIHVRVGIHFGKAVLVQGRGHVEVAGRAINIAARVEAGGGKQTDQILMSDAAVAQLDKSDEFLHKPAAIVDAKGLARGIQLHQLIWQKNPIELSRSEFERDSASRPLVLAAQSDTGKVPNDDVQADARGCHCLFVDPDTRRGHVIPVWIRVDADKSPGIRCLIDCDRVMAAAVERAIESAFEVLEKLGFSAANISNQAVEWWIEEGNVRYEGASLGLAVALATVAAYTGTQIDPAIAVTGAVHEGRVIPVAGIADKWQALRASGRFKQLVLSTENMRELPADAKSQDQLQVIAVPDVESAVLDVIGPALGVAARRLTVSSNLPSIGSERGVDVQLWIQQESEQSMTRNISIVPQEDVHNWMIGQKIRFCIKVDRDCHLSLINIGATGNVTVLIPNSLHPETAVKANQAKTFPTADDPFSLELKGPPGRERVIAIATAQPLSLVPEDFEQSGQIVCARPSTRDIECVARDIENYEMGRCEICFYVSAQESDNSDIEIPTYSRVDLN